MKASVHNHQVTADNSSSDEAGQTFYDAPALPPKRAGRQTVDTGSKPSKRARIRPPAAGLHGVKRVVAAARDGPSGAGRGDRGDVNADASGTTFAQESNAEEDDSFARMKRPKKKVKQKHAPLAADSAPAAGKAVPLATGKKRKAVAVAAGTGTATGETSRQAKDKPALSSDSEPDAPIQSAPTGGRSKAVRQAVSIPHRGSGFIVGKLADFRSRLPVPAR